MTPDRIFAIVNAAALISWVLLAVLPRRRWVTNTLTRAVVPRFTRAEGGAHA